MEIYVVQPGDTLESIAREYGVPVSRVILLNDFSEDDKLAVGQTVLIPLVRETYTVEQGDTLDGIAQRFGITVNEILQNNPQLIGRDELAVGQTLFLSYNVERKRNIAVNGYIYPFVDRDLLIRTLPYLTYLTLFTYGFTPQGELVYDGITEYGLDEDEIISLCYQYNVAPIMHLSTLTREGVFDSALGNAILNNIDAQNVLIGNIISRLQEKNYYGFDVDFEYLDASNRDLYTGFVGRLQNALSENGYILITALAPKSYGEQPGDFYESHDYGGIGALSDYVLLMTYEWGYAFGPPMAVSPLDQMERVVRYAVSVIDPDKIFLGIPNYAYDWPLPYVMGTTKADKISNTNAVDMSITNGAVIMYDENAQTPYYNYQKAGKSRVVWFDNARSIREKLALVDRYGLYGIGIWNLMQWFQQGWLVLISEYGIDKVV